jgi:hypothetical protein
MLWWDLTRAKFLENSIGEVVYRSTTWNKLYASASIDLYEWVETKYLPSEWDKLADTEKGLANNISGKSKYGDSVYSVVQTYDTVSRKFINVYYFWVKNTTVVPNVKGRNLSCSEISKLIEDPVGNGYACIALTGPNSFSLVNIENLLKDDQVVLSAQYWTIDNQELNVHSQWALINESSLQIPKNIENKWIHSLVGRDDNNKPIPDLRRKSIDDCIGLLRKDKFIEINESYDYLLNLPYKSISLTNMNKHISDLESLIKEIQKLESLSKEELWYNDLELFHINK